MALDGVELVGYIASALVVASLAMASVVRLRVLSLIGSATFVVYGVLIESIPIIVTNASIALLNVWFLGRELGGKRDLDAVAVPVDSPFLVDFLERHRAEISQLQPDHDPDEHPDLAFVLVRDRLPAGVLLGEHDGDRLHVLLDYVLAAYRDSRIGRWLFGPGAGVLRSRGIAVVTADGHSDTHRAYLRRIGFEPIGDDRFEKRL